jgi:hypothetical protein
LHIVVVLIHGDPMCHEVAELKATLLEGSRMAPQLVEDNCWRRFTVRNPCSRRTFRLECHMKRTVILAAIAVVATVLAAHAAETVTYTYDAKGRLIKVVRVGSVNNNVQTSYSYDKANNRKTVATTGSSQSQPSQ